MAPRYFETIFLVVIVAFVVVPLTVAEAYSSIHELLRSHGLPAGLFPESVKSYNLDQRGRLEVKLDRPCMAKYETRVLFETVVRANLSFGQLKGLEGLSQEELFLWLPVKDIIVDDPSSGLILIDIGLAYKQLSLSLFEDPPVCRSHGSLSPSLCECYIFTDDLSSIPLNLSIMRFEYIEITMEKNMHAIFISSIITFLECQFLFVFRVYMLCFNFDIEWGAGLSLKIPGRKSIGFQDQR